jgi:hypothetical protein
MGKILIANDSENNDSDLRGMKTLEVEGMETPFMVIFTRKIWLKFFIVIKIKEKKKVSVSPPITDPPQVLVEIPIDWS